ncbi:cytochrome ubiquinol oxidase subunit I [Actinoallomurus sp. NBC_01490]|uniref:cytochrome ubiquinol oxidase subunit I n=1 Tax=Actinoallomurus sp. NBC_01490 TaxID=2903557 RepID=UPI002E308A1D|nr:cytochrome ubiquinol oxidase subunit I [Actinoallomurus sp. NBC_01490]
MLRGRRNRYHRLGLLVPLTFACCVTALQIVVGDWAARYVAAEQPAKLAAMEGLYRSEHGVPESIGGLYHHDALHGAIRVPGGLSLLTHGNTHAYAAGLDGVPADQRPPVNIVHLSFDTMVGIGFFLLALGAWPAWTWWRRREPPGSSWFLRAVTVSGVAAIIAMEAGWVTTEVGRQPWIVYGVLRVKDTVNPAGGIGWGFPALVAVYVALTVATVYVLRYMVRRRPVAFGIIARGSAFAFRKVVEDVWLQRLFGAAFALSSVLTPYFLGAAAGGVASGRVPPGIARGNVITSWANPTSTVCGLLGVALCAYLSAIYLTADARRGGHHELAEYFRRNGLVTGVAMGVLSLASLAVVQDDAPDLYHSLTHRGLPLVISSMLMGAVSLALLARRNYASVRVSAALAVAAILWAWGYGRYPTLLPGLEVGQAASAHATLQATALSSAVGLTILLPSLAWLFILFQRAHTAPQDPRVRDSSPR